MPTVPITDFDHHSADFAFHRDETLRGLREHSPIVWSKAYGGFWVVTSHELICKIMRDDVTFTVARGPDGSGGITIPENVNKPAVLPGEVDGERHEIYRRALSPYFAKSTIEGLVTHARDSVDGLLDIVEKMQSFDAMTDFARRVPQRVIYSYLGIEVEDPWELFEAVESIRMEPTASQAAETMHRLRTIVRKKRASGSDDVLGQLARSEDPPFDEEDLVNLCIGLILGGVRTTGDLIANCLWQLEIDREQRQHLMHDNGAIAPFVEECLRFYSPSVTIARTVTKPAEIGGVALKPGDRVLNVLYSANHDEARYGSDDKVSPGRKPAQHVAFGIGAHFCLGSWLARLEARVAIQRLLTRLPDYEIDRSGAVRGLQLGLRSYWDTLPARTAHRAARESEES